MRERARRLLVFGKLPAAGRVKTRLAPALGAEGAAALYAAFLEDTAASARRVDGAEVQLWLEAPGGGEGRDGLEGREAGRRLARRLGLGLRWQRGEELGERLRRAFARAFAEGADSAVAVGSDHPTLPPARIEAAFRALTTAEVAIGPSEDGGYYLIGLSRPAWPRAAELFRRIPWSTPRVLARTRAAVARLGLSTRELAPWYDVDVPRDLARLRRDLSLDSRTAAALARWWGSGQAPEDAVPSGPPRQSPT